MPACSSTVCCAKIRKCLGHETMGFLEFRAGHLEESRKWYEQAVKLDSQSYLAHYYFAAISMNSAGEPNSETDAQVEASLRAAIKLNPSFAPPMNDWPPSKACEDEISMRRI